MLVILQSRRHVLVELTPKVYSPPVVLTGKPTVAPNEPAALIDVRRRGNLRGDVTFTWWTESGTAKPGEDY